MNTIKHYLKKCREVFEAYGDESSRDTFKGELNCDAGKIFYMMLVALVGWVRYIPTDMELHQYPMFAAGIRIGLSVLAATLIALKFTIRFRNHPSAMLTVLVIYLNVGASVLAATAGEKAGTYISGFSLTFMITTFATLSVFSKTICSLFAFVLFFVVAAFCNMDFSDMIIQYAVNDIIIALVLSILLSYVLNNVKRLSWERNQMLKVASKTKSDFLARMSHEIRTPMNAITGMAELAMRENLPNSAQEHVRTIKQAGSNLLAIINDILDFSKIESGKLEILPVEYQLRKLINDVVSIIRMRVVDSPVRFVVNVTGGIPNNLFGDEVRVRQVLLNILGNAVKYTSEGYVSLVVKGRVVNDETVVLIIEVTDTGKGIKEEDVKKLFGSFVQVDAESNRGIEGTGLGLAITKSLVTAMGGEVGVSSTYGMGSVFTVKLPQKILSHAPIAKVDKPETKSVLIYDRRKVCADSMIATLGDLNVVCVRAESDIELRRVLKERDFAFVFAGTKLLTSAREIMRETNSKAQLVQLASFGNEIADKDLSVIAMPAYCASVADILNGVTDNSSYGASSLGAVTFCAPEARVLVVDDIRTNLEVAKGLLAPYKMQVDTCLSGEESIRAVLENSYDIIFMDHMMPVMDGIEAVQRIRKLGGEKSKVPIIALTANAVAGAKEMFIKNQFNNFLSKPIDVVKLNEALEVWLPKSKRKRISAEEVTAETDKIDNANIVINGVDVGVGMSRTGGTLAGYMRTLAIFCDDAKEKIGEINGCLTADNLQLYTTLVHALKSALANIGAVTLSDVAKSLEAAGKNGDVAYIKSHTPRLLADLEKLLSDVCAVVFANKQERATATANIDKNALNAVLAKLKLAIDEMEPSAINAAVKELEPFEHVENIGVIMKHVLNGEYDEAEKLALTIAT